MKKTRFYIWKLVWNNPELVRNVFKSYVSVSAAPALFSREIEHVQTFELVFFFNGTLKLFAVYAAPAGVFLGKTTHVHIF